MLAQVYLAHRGERQGAGCLLRGSLDTESAIGGGYSQTPGTDLLERLC